MKKIFSVIMALMLTGYVAVSGAVITLDPTLYTSQLESLRTRITDIETLISRCEAEGLPTDYETMRLEIVKKYTDYLDYEINYGIAYRTEENGYTEDDVKAIHRYNIKSLNTIADEAEENLTAYLDGTKTPMQVPELKTSKTQIEGRAVTAETELNGVTERSKVFLNGYGHYSAYEQYDFLKKTGSNLIQTEIGLSAYCREANGITDWITAYHLKPEAEMTITDEAYRRGGKSLKITNKTPITSSYYLQLYQPVKVEPATKYTFSFYAKGENITNFVYKTTASGTFKRITYSDAVTLDDWTKYEVTYTTGAEQTIEKLYLSTEGATDVLYIDDVSFKRTDGNTNLISNGSFEEQDGEDKILDADYYELWQFEERLKEAEEKNVKVDVLLASHYFLWSLAEQYPDMLERDTSMGFRLSHEAVRRALKFNAQTIAELVSKYDCVNSICMANEPKHNPKLGGEESFYRDDYTAFFEREYGTIANYNSVYGTKYSEFSQIPMLATNVSSRCDVAAYDYVKFAEEIAADWVKFMQESIREVSDVPVHLKTMRSVGWSEDDDNRWLYAVGFDPQEYSDYVDINGNDSGLMFPANYDGDFSEYAEYRLMTQSMLYDYHMSIKEAPVYNSEDHLLANGDKTYRSEHGKLIGAAQWMGAVHGRAMQAVWIFDRSESRAETYESIMYRPDLCEVIGEANLDLNRLADEVYSVIDKPFNIGIFYSDASRNYSYTLMNTVYKAYKACLYNGTRPGFVVEKQLEKLNNYKVVILPYVTHIPDTALSALKEYVQNGGKIISLGSTLAYNERGVAHSSADISAILGKAVSIPVSAETRYIANVDEMAIYNAVYDATVNYGLCDVEIKDAQTGARVYEVEYLASELDGDRIISICNYDWDADKTVNIYVDGELVTQSLELRSGEAVGESLTLKSCEPVLIKIAAEPEPEIINAIDNVSIYRRSITFNVNINTDITDAMAVAASYGSDGTLQRVSISEATDFAKGTTTVDDCSLASEWSQVKIMLWDKATQKPYCESVTVTE